jgi:hypothetical protein
MFFFIFTDLRVEEGWVRLRRAEEGGLRRIVLIWKNLILHDAFS